MSAEAAVDVSVALLTHNAGPLLERVLRAVRDQNTRRLVELVAVDTNSNDDTVERLEAYGGRVARIAPEQFNFGSTRDQVFEMARGRVVVSLSQDAVPAHGDWLENLVRPLNDDVVAASCGRSIPDPQREFAQFAWERNGHFYFTREMRRFFTRYGRGLSNANAAIRRSVWERLRFGAQPIGEDFLFQTKLHAEELAVAFPDGAEVLHHHQYTVRTAYNRCRNEGLGLRLLDCRYGLHDAIRDAASLRVWGVWAREAAQGRLTNAAEWLFPLLRPCAVYAGSRFGRDYRR